MLITLELLGNEYECHLELTVDKWKDYKFHGLKYITDEGIISVLDELLDLPHVRDQITRQIIEEELL